MLTPLLFTAMSFTAAFARADTRIPLMYMPDGVRALLELAMAEPASLTRTIYNIAAFSPRADVPPPAGLAPLSSYNIDSRFRALVSDESRLTELRKRFGGYIARR